MAEKMQNFLLVHAELKGVTSEKTGSEIWKSITTTTDAEGKPVEHRVSFPHTGSGATATWERDYSFTGIVLYFKLILRYLWEAVYKETIAGLPFTEAFVGTSGRKVTDQSKKWENGQKTVQVQLNAGKFMQAIDKLYLYHNDLLKEVKGNKYSRANFFKAIQDLQKVQLKRVPNSILPNNP
jgi:hypothetical protein